uniref:Minor capsid component n=1 Tax=virus sp. ctuZj11 TaxID=2825825 RepID=A0A8S5RAY6_9VIRU|nr:MAG TPA: minor capsid component [virus sp. ctuZj11]
MPETDKEKEDEEYLAITAAFQRFVDRVRQGRDPDDEFEELVTLRAESCMRHAFSGFGYEWDEALELIRNKDDLSALDREKRAVLLAAVDNIVDFATAEEHQMVSELPDFDEEDDDAPDRSDESDSDPDEDDMMETWLAICSKYNDRYAHVENQDVEYAMIVAAAYISYSSESTLMYMTMGDERVRPWHLQYEGFTAPKSSFPAWLIPPIEHGCRCYLVDEHHDSMVGVVVAQKMPEMPEWFNPTFKESVAQGGRIFSDEHPYFNISKEHVGHLRTIAEKIKSRYIG